jgi:multidrug efflux system outer membrane protein
MFNMDHGSWVIFKNSLGEFLGKFSGGGRLRHFAKRSLALAAGIGLVLICGCAVGPDFQQPQVSVPAGWAGPVAESPQGPAASGNIGLADWWTLFQDQILTSLIERAAASNLDLKLAEARIREARAAKGVAAGGLGPTLDASGSYQRSRSSAENRTNATTGDQYQAGFDAGWEIDIFGGQRRSVEAADADLQAAVETQRDVLVSLTAEVARNYINLRAFQQQIAITRKNLAAQKHSALLTRQRFEGGFVSGLDVANAEAQSATTGAQIPLLESSVQQAIYSLSVLLGEPPAALAAELSPVGTIPGALPEVPAGVPSDLLRRRPDIRRAESQIHAATARIGVAAAELFPKFTIAGSAGFQSTDFSSWFNWANRFWSFGPSVRWRLFETGRIRAGVELQKALQDQEVITYQQTVLSALQEVENALIVSDKEQAHREALVTAVTANRKAVALAETLYTEGQTDFLNVLQAQGALYTTEDALVQSTRTVSTNLVALYKALGGGWQNSSAAKAAALAE